MDIRLSSVILTIEGFKDSKGALRTVEEFFADGGQNADCFIDVIILGRDVVNSSAQKLEKARYYLKDISYNSCFKKGTTDVVEIPEDFGGSSTFYDHHN